MKTSFYLHSEIEKNLHCLIRVGNDEVSFSLEHAVNKKLWDSKKGEFIDNDPYNSVLMNVKRYFIQRYSELKEERKDNTLKILKKEALDLIRNESIEGISRKIFETMGNKVGLPKYDGYLFAFEKYTGLKRENYKVEILDFLLHFHTEKGIYEMDTYPGKISFLKSIITSRLYENITVLTDAEIWSEIYGVERGIEKEKFLSIMLKELEYCIKNNYQSTGLYFKSKDSEKIGKDLMEQFEVFKTHYENSNVVDLAFEINEHVLFPVTVITMTEIFDLNACCEEYCDLEFNNKKWKAIFMDSKFEKEDDYLPVFYIKPYK